MRGTLAALALVIASCASSTPTNGGDVDGRPGDHPDAHVGSHPDANNVNGPDANTVPADANNCSVQPCTLDPQCGCSGTTACDIGASGNACRPAGAGNTGDTCSSSNDCAAGYVCLGDATNADCNQYCTSNTECGSPRGQCVVQVIDSNNQPLAGAVVCSSNCDPAAISNPLCPATWTCDIEAVNYPYPSGANYDIAGCRKAGTLTEGGDCTSAACASGYACINTGSANECERICKYPSGNECSGVLHGGSATSCNVVVGPDNNPFIIGGQQYGSCR